MNRLHIDYSLPKAVVWVVIGLIIDYERRDKVIRGIYLTNGETIQRCRQINSVIDEAFNIGVEPGIKQGLILDIKNGYGYSKSHVKKIISKNAYYIRKRRIIHDIAVGLNLI